MAQTSDGYKTCTKCGKSKPLSEFHRCKRFKDGHVAQCKVCRSAIAAQRYIEKREELLAAHKQYNAEHPEVRRNSHLMRTFGKNTDWYAAPLEAQGGGCAICGRTEEENGKSLAVDHDHETGEIRGLLCCGCNRGLGGFRDRPALMLRAIDYLKRSA